MSDVVIVRTDSETAQIVAGMMRLAAATRDTSIDSAVCMVYLSNLEGYDTADIVAVCRALEATEEWFPKVAVLRKAIIAHRRKRQDAEEAFQRSIRGGHEPLISDEKHAEMMAKFKAATRAHRMPKVAVPDAE